MFPNLRLKKDLLSAVLPISVTAVPAYLSCKSVGGSDIPVDPLKPCIWEGVVTVITKHKSRMTIRE